MFPVFYVQAQGIKILITTQYLIMASIIVANLWEGLFSSLFVFSIDKTLPPTNIPGFEGMTAAMQANTYIGSVYWWYAIFASRYKFLVYLLCLGAVVVGLRHRYVWPIAIGVMIIEIGSDVIRSGLTFYLVNNLNVCFLCWPEIPPFGMNSPNAPNVYFVWYMWLNIFVSGMGIVMFVSILGLKQLAVALAPDEFAVLGVEPVGGEQLYIPIPIQKQRDPLGVQSSYAPLGDSWEFPAPDRDGYSSTGNSIDVQMTQKGLYKAGKKPRVPLRIRIWPFTLEIAHMEIKNPFLYEVHTPQET